MTACTTQGGGEVIKNHRMAAPLGLRALTRIVHDEGVDMGYRSKRQLRPTRTAQANTFAR